MSYSSNQPLVSNQLPISIEFPLEQGRLVETITDTYKRTVSAINTKADGLYTLNETASFKQYFSSQPNFFRSGYRYVYDVVSENGGNIGAGSTVIFPTGIAGMTMLTDIYGTAKTSGNKFFGINYPDVYIQGTNVVFTNPEPSILTQAQIVLEYLKE